MTADAPPPVARPDRRRRWIIAAVSVLLVVLLVVLAAMLRANGEEHRDRAGHGEANAARARLAARGGNPYIGTIGDVSDPVALRRSLRAEFHRSGSAPPAVGDPAAARACARQLAAAGGSGDAPVVLLADGSSGGSPVVVVAVADRGRVVAFVADPGTCVVRAAQSL